MVPSKFRKKANLVQSGEIFYSDYCFYLIVNVLFEICFLKVFLSPAMMYTYKYRRFFLEELI